MRYLSTRGGRSDEFPVIAFFASILIEGRQKGADEAVVTQLGKLSEEAEAQIKSLSFKTLKEPGRRC